MQSPCVTFLESLNDSKRFAVVGFKGEGHPKPKGQEQTKT